ncbi:uncharacterized protein TRIADDRAFT_59200 [Trichoplax adhaerens]|uniref:Uncharacterized protein n=1 Tax=Trichoplax adhaerens TaxID=10228 RepID=B3S553_TRIAD|nr:hypothetical protein TRIADDRAFT_59200 [Trichoplax adhaerens]EDV22206.1 hypothetical protein TRIADDRAFT_59200 [Trichoplax adhaerens]|eukprot:XP_002115361.1 hypothetical protein TRIADDRAFT_59200 [Trichoplax adhaerens]
MSSWEQRAVEAEKKGDAAAEEKKPIEAALHYTEAIKIQPAVYHLYLKRSKVFLQMEHHSLALQDAILYIQRSRNKPDGYIMKAEIEHSAQHYKNAVISYRLAAEKTKDARGKKKIEECLKQSLDTLQEQRRKEGRRPLFCLAVSLVLAIIIVIIDSRILQKPLLRDNLIAQGSVIFIISAFGYGIGKLTNWVIESDRNSLLEAPIDLLDLGNNTSETSRDKQRNQTSDKKSTPSHTKSD